MSNRFIDRCQHHKQHSTLSKGRLRFNGVSITLHKNRKVCEIAVYVIFWRTISHGGAPDRSALAGVHVGRRWLRRDGQIAFPFQREDTLRSDSTYIPCSVTAFYRLLRKHSGLEGKGQERPRRVKLRINFYVTRIKQKLASLINVKKIALSLLFNKSCWKILCSAPYVIYSE